MSTSPHAAALPSTAAARVVVRYDVPIVADEWVLPEVPVPESASHTVTVDLVQALLRAWVARSGRNAFVARNLAFRWDERHPSIGVDPDVCVIEPAPPEGEAMQSLLLWASGHHAPRLVIEVVSRNHPYKDYDVVPDKYAASGVGELWVFDPELIGPKKRGGPHRLQLWTRAADSSFLRSYAGDGPMFTPALGAWAFAAHDGKRLRIAEDEACTSPWLTGEEAERAAKEAERAAKEAERAAKEAALRRVSELEAELARSKH